MKFIKLFFFLVSVGVLAQENVIGDLPDEVKENSGLLFYNGKLITHNDSGNTAQLFEIDTLSLAITRVITIENAVNTDWEDIAQDEDYIYIGDIGNNNGDRQDLSVYRILKSEFDTATNVLAEKIEFSYEDQTSFTTTPKSDWDAEALVVIENKLMVLTKQWQSNKTVAYTFPKTPGTYSASKVGTYNIQGLVTGATINTKVNELYIVGYSQTLTPFFAEVTYTDASHIFDGDVKKTILNIGLAQIEAIAQKDDTTFYFASERFVNNIPPFTIEAALFSLVLPNKEIVTPEVGGEEEKEVLVVYKSFDSDVLNYQLNTEDEVLRSYVYSSSGQQLFKETGTLTKDGVIDISSYTTAVYYLVFQLQNGMVFKSFIKN